jgi:hypothetical protein
MCVRIYVYMNKYVHICVREYYMKHNAISNTLSNLPILCGPGSRFWIALIYMNMATRDDRRP